jgi:hypothetical protein|tara:strand:+ start:1389 stop:1604 length:216 start_codon:yes stop_codon:yes gene_type:complete
MTRKDYIELAEMVKNSKIESNLLGYTEEEKKGINNFVDTVLVNNLINVLEADNPNFSRGRFLIAINDTEQV